MRLLSLIFLMAIVRNVALGSAASPQIPEDIPCVISAELKMVGTKKVTELRIQSLTRIGLSNQTVSLEDEGIRLGGPTFVGSVKNKQGQEIQVETIVKNEKAPLGLITLEQVLFHVKMGEGPSPWDTDSKSCTPNGGASLSSTPGTAAGSPTGTATVTKPDTQKRAPSGTGTP